MTFEYWVNIKAAPDTNVLHPTDREMEGQTDRHVIVQADRENIEGQMDVYTDYGGISSTGFKQPPVLECQNVKNRYNYFLWQFCDLCCSISGLYQVK